MSIELWGTFSVRDHLVERAFIADVLLYDRLVIPTRPDGTPGDDWPAAWKSAKQRTLLGDLAELAISVPWDAQRREQWQKRFDAANDKERRLAHAKRAEAVALDVAAARAQKRPAGYNITRRLLQDFANLKADDALFKKLRVTRKVRPGATLEAVSAYTSFDKFSTDVPSARAPAKKSATLPHDPTAVFGWKFFVPEDAEKGEAADRKLLAKAMKLARKTEFIEMRSDFYDWWGDVIANGLPEEDARADLEARIVEFNKLMAGQGWKTGVRYAVKVADAFSGGLGLVNEVVGAGAEAFFGSADILADERLKRQTAPPRLKVAALFHDARTQLGWKAK